jgi:ABC-2 type transport system ATP-binding protein
VFLNSHLLGEVEATCDRVVFVKAGRTVHELSLGADALGLDVELRTGALGNGTTEALAQFGRVEPVADTAATPESARMVPGLALAARTRLRVADETVLPAIAKLLVERGVPLYEMKAARTSLEAWFLEVMGEEQRPG